MYSINFIEIRKKCYLSFHDNGGNSYLFANGTEFVNLEQKTLKLMQFHYV